MKAQYTPAIQKMISVFTVSKPYELEYSYRKNWGKEALKKDLPILKEMMSMGLVELVGKGPTKILYRYKGEKEVLNEIK